MAQIAQVVNNRNPALCDICQQKPKFGAYNYCGKNCAAQAATLCDFCHQKPKFNGHDYCSKKCGSQAKGRNQFTAPKANGGQNRNVRGKKGASGFTMPIPQPAQVLNAVGQILPHLPQQGKMGQIAQATAQLLPHLQAMVQQPGQNYGQAFPVQPQSQPMPTKGMYNAQQAAPLVDITSIPIMPGNYQPPAPGQTITNGINATPMAECQIPECQKPAHVDPCGGQVSYYCSKQHREEAVKRGLVDACIMCLKMPQSDNDHFCSKACKDEALSRPN